MLVVPETGVLVDRERNQYILKIAKQSTVDRIRSALPNTFVREWNGWKLVVLPVHDDTLRILRNLGFPTTGMEPFRWYYNKPLIEGKYPPLSHQIETAVFLSSYKRAYCLNSPRLGKTSSMIMCTDYLQTMKGVTGAVLVVATVSNLTGVWQHTIRTTLPQRTCVVVHGGIGKKDRLAKLRRPADYYVINYDGVKMVEEELCRMVEDGRIGIVVVDELTHYGNIKSQRFKAMDHVINGRTPVKYAYGLTGSPGENPIPIFGFAKLINPDKLPCKRMYTWQELTMVKFGMASWQWRNRKECPDIINATLQPAIRFDKKDIMDLPPVVHQMRDCDLSAPQKAAYRRMREEMIALTADGKTIEAVHKASLSQKLFQIALGTAIGQDHKLVELDNKPRLQTILEVIGEATSKVVIFCPYTGVIDRLAKQLAAEKFTVGVVDGRTTGHRRAELFRDFQEAKDPHILICHPQTTAFGVELAAADTMIFNGPPLSGGFIYEQALERLSSLKQKAKQISIVQIAATEEERKFFEGLDAGVKASELINDMFAAMTKGRS